MGPGESSRSTMTTPPRMGAPRKIVNSLPKHRERCVAEVPTGQRIFAFFLMAIVVFGVTAFLTIESGILPRLLLK